MELENRLVKLESKLVEVDNVNLGLQMKVSQLENKVDHLMDVIKTKFGKCVHKPMLITIINYNWIIL